MTVNGNSIRISFQWQGRRCRETLALAPTPPNLKHAGAMLRRIKDEIALGTFTTMSARPVFGIKKDSRDYSDEELLARILKLRGFLSVMHEIAGQHATELSQLEGERKHRRMRDE